ncbi:MAG TPA: hypothetical protein VG268_12195 [Streptosporangiaceae bacterium]|nr:hypothetical protein [Streptosporangiaceae bacterium]
MAPWDVSGTASRVTDSYRMLLDTIGLAFDERSAREGDRMQKAGMWLAVGFGLLACPAPRRRRRDLAALAAVAHFGPYPLPILISLYRLCSARELRDWRTA